MNFGAALFWVSSRNIVGRVLFYVRDEGLERYSRCHCIAFIKLLGAWLANEGDFKKLGYRSVSESFHVIAVLEQSTF